MSFRVASERATYEKIVVAHLASQDTRLTPDHFLIPLLEKDETSSDAYLTYEFLRGRTPSFIAFLMRELGYNGEAEARSDLWAKYGDRIEARMQRFRERGR